MFRTPEGQARYFAAYEKTLGLWPVPVESFDVTTRFGLTHVNVCGVKDSPPLILFHGAAISSTQWYPNVESLSQHYRIYAPDILGEVGKSIRTGDPLKPEDYPIWISDLLAGLDLESAHVGGLSLGGYIAVTMAIKLSNRVKKLILMAPAGIAPLRKTSYLRMAIAFVPFLSRKIKQRVILGTNTPILNPLIDQVTETGDFRYNLFLPPNFSDEELQNVKASTLLLLGENEVIFNIQRIMKRCRQNIPVMTTRVIANAGHALSIDQPEIVNRYVIEFLQT